MARLPAQARKTTLHSSGVSIGDTTADLSFLRDIDGNDIAMAVLGDKAFATVEPGTENEEQIAFTGIVLNPDGTRTLTGVTSVSPVSPYTETAGFRKSHSGATTFILSNTSGFYDQFVSKNTAGTVEEAITFDAEDAPRYDTMPAFEPGSDLFLVPKKYVDEIAVAGVADASTAQAGKFEEATDAELQAGTASGSSGSRLAAGGTSFTETPTPNKVPVANSLGKILHGWLNLAADFAFTGLVDIVAANWKLGGVAYTGTMDNLNEAAAFFGSTTLTGAEAEALKATVVGVPFVAGEAIALHDAVAVPSSTTTLTATTLGTTSYQEFSIGQSATDTKWAQSFTGVSGLYNNITLNGLSRTSAIPADSLQVTIQTNVGSAPSGVVLATATLIPGSSLSTSQTNVTVSFPPLTFVSGTTYWVVVERTGAISGSNYYRAYFSNVAYANGTSLSYTGAAWVANPYSASYDLNATLGRSVTAGLAYKADSDYAMLANTFIGFANATAALGASVNVQVEGVHSGLSGLTPGATHYVAATPGTVSTTPGTNSKVAGRAVTATSLLVIPS